MENLSIAVWLAIFLITLFWSMGFMVTLHEMGWDKGIKNEAEWHRQCVEYCSQTKSCYC